MTRLTKLKFHKRSNFVIATSPDDRWLIDGLKEREDQCFYLLSANFSSMSATI